MIFFEDVAIGAEVALGSFAFEAEDIKRFARLYDPQAFHLDEEAAKASHFGGLCASGWHTASVWMKLMVAHAEREAAAARARGERSARLGPSPGFKDLKWLKPVYAGDVLTYASTVVDKRVSSSRPEWGLVTHHNRAENAAGESVFELVATVFLERRPG